MTALSLASLAKKVVASIKVDMSSSSDSLEGVALLICSAWTWEDHYSLLNQSVCVRETSYDWKYFVDPCEVALGLSTDSFAPFKKWSKTTWPIILVNYNLPPDVHCHLKHILSLGVIPGPTKPHDWDLFLWPLMEELSVLASDQGVPTVDILQDFKGMSEGNEEYQFALSVWEAVGLATAKAGDTIPSTFDGRVPNIQSKKSEMNAEQWSFWALYIAPVVLCRCFMKPHYYNHFVELYEISREEIDDLEAGFSKWVEEYERSEILPSSPKAQHCTQKSPSFAMQFGSKIGNVRKALAMAVIEEYGAVKRIDSEEGDTMCCSSLYKPPQDSHDPTFVQSQLILTDTSTVFNVH
ncbi:hypothetical protein D9758_015334 [Tetrapyrgos nigripes]|uniref:Uncharacterized protein n=1 Tax=Tetrapyrgos nigripes TaxID=182062 RepID=A0A8H5CL51_9AGAR|nr:hypothetical protein D9758_015334 [Tetrapyrgos nigripes]